MLLPFTNLFFSNERHKEVDPDGRGGGDKLGKRGAAMRINCMKKEPTFNKRGKKEAFV